MTLLFISLLPCNSVGLDFGLSCFFMWLLCFLIGWRSWPECQCPGIRYCTLPGEVESEMPLCPSPDPFLLEHSATSPPARGPASPLGEGGSSLLELPTSTWAPKPLALEDITSPQFGTLTWPVLREREPGVCLSPHWFLRRRCNILPSRQSRLFPSPTEGWPWPGDKVLKVMFLFVLHTPFHSFHLRRHRKWLG